MKNMTEKKSEFKLPIEILYPTLELDKDKTVLPKVNLPMNYKEIVPKFYAQKGKEKIENYVKGLEKISEDLLEIEIDEGDIRLNWDERVGLRNISLGIHPGFDLNESGLPHFEEHNLGWRYSILAYMITTKYISELLKSE